MRIPSILLFSLLLACPLLPAQAPGGVAAEWNTRENIAAMGKKLQEVRPILDQLKPQQWVEKGASDGYVQQFESVLEELRGVEWSLGNLSKSPEKLSFAVDSYLRVQSMRGKVSSVNEAVRRYQNAAIAELIDAYLADSSGSQNELMVYLRELSEQKEAELEVMAEETQRCRVERIQRRPAAKE